MFRCPKCGEPLQPFTPSTLAQMLVNYSLKEVIELQFELAKVGVCVTFQTAEVIVEENAASLGRSNVGSHDPLED